MRKLLAEPFWRKRTGRWGDRARSYSWDRIAAGTLAVYEDVVGADACATTMGTPA
jgi:hypothetical protein